MRGRQKVKVPYSDFDMNVVETLTRAGYVESVQRKGRGTKRIIDIKLKYNEGGDPAISGIKFVSKPSRRMYMGYKDLSQSHQGYGRFVISTPEGVMDNNEARKKKVGGQVLFEIW